MEHKIIAFIEADGQIVVRYSNDAPPLAIDLPIDEAGNYPEGVELEQYISGFIPHVDTRRKDALAAGIPNAAVIAALVVEDPVASVDTSAASAPDEAALLAAQQFEQEAFDARVKDALGRLGVVVP